MANTEHESAKDKVSFKQFIHVRCRIWRWCLFPHRRRCHLSSSSVRLRRTVVGDLKSVNGAGAVMLGRRRHRIRRVATAKWLCVHNLARVPVNIYVCLKLSRFPFCQFLFFVHRASKQMTCTRAAIAVQESGKEERKNEPLPSHYHFTYHPCTLTAQIIIVVTDIYTEGAHQHHPKEKNATRKEKLYK